MYKQLVIGVINVWNEFINISQEILTENGSYCQYYWIQSIL